MDAVFKFANPAKARDLALRLLKNGADVSLERVSQSSYRLAATGDRLPPKVSTSDKFVFGRGFVPVSRRFSFRLSLPLPKHRFVLTVIAITVITGLLIALPPSTSLKQVKTSAESAATCKTRLDAMKAFSREHLNSIANLPANKSSYTLTITDSENYGGIVQYLAEFTCDGSVQQFEVVFVSPTKAKWARIN